MGDTLGIIPKDPTGRAWRLAQSHPANHRTPRYDEIALIAALDAHSEAVRPQVLDVERAGLPLWHRTRFEREVSNAKQVSGNYTARLIDADVQGDPPWLATEFIAGPTLHEAVSSGERFHGEVLRALAVGLADALAAIHAKAHPGAVSGVTCSGMTTPRCVPSSPSSDDLSLIRVAVAFPDGQ